MIDSIVFYSKTELNGKFQVKTTVELNGEGIKKIQSGGIHTHKNIIYKNLNNYWVSKKEIECIIENYNTEPTYF